MTTTNTGAILVGLTGHLGSGKDQVADILRSGHGFLSFEFAENIRELLYQQDPLLAGRDSLREVVDAIGWDRAKRDRHLGAEILRLMQASGDAGMSLFGQDCWIRALERDIAQASALSTPSDRVVLADVHTAEEARWVRSRGGEIWQVCREGQGPVNGHRTEHPIPALLIDQVLMADDLARLGASVSGHVARIEREYHTQPLAS